ncbi:MAG: glutathione S-transferase family protein [Deltaproteobacteria bacterium]|nr:glutathione S-transferase family protein [Deltaproteobacteria bacterium]
MIRVFGAPPNRTHRVLWMLEEGGLEHELVPLHTAEEVAGCAELARLNPNRRVPTLVDGDVVVWDSLAINLYLSERYRLLPPEGTAGRAHAVQWSIWAQTDVDGPMLSLLKSRSGPEPERDLAVEATAETTLRGRLAVLEEALAGREHLLGGGFTVADLNVAAVVAPVFLVKIDLHPFPRARGWLRTALARPAAQKIFALAMQGSPAPAG